MNDMNEEEMESIQKAVEKLLNEQDYYAILNVEPTVSFIKLRHRQRKMRSVKHTRNGA